MKHHDSRRSRPSWAAITSSKASEALDRYAARRRSVRAPCLRPGRIVRPGRRKRSERSSSGPTRPRTPLVPVSSGAPHFHGDTVPSGAGRRDRRPPPPGPDPAHRPAQPRGRRRTGRDLRQLQPALAEQGMRVTPPLLPRGEQVRDREPARAPADADPALQLRAARAAAGLRRGVGQRRGTVHRRGGLGPAVARRPVAGGLRAGRAQGARPDRLLPPAHGRPGHDGHRHLGLREVRAAAGGARAAASSPRAASTSSSTLVRGCACCAWATSSWSSTAAISSGVLLGAGAPRRPPAAGLDARRRASAAAALRPDERVRVQEDDARGWPGSSASSCATSSRAWPPARSTGRSAALVPEPHWKLHRQGGTPTSSSSTTLDKVAAATWRSCAPRPSGTASPPTISASTCSRSTRASRHHVEFSLPFDAGDAGERGRAQRASRRRRPPALIAAGAYFSPPLRRLGRPVYGRDAASRDALRKVKAIFDPNGVMNPGKLCFGPPARAREEA